MLIENSMFEDSPNSMYQSIQLSLDPTISAAKKDKIARAIVVEARHVLFKDFVDRILDGEIPGNVVDISTLGLATICTLDKRTWNRRERNDLCPVYF